MTINNGYATSTEFLAYALPNGGTSSGDDAVIEAIIEASSRVIDNETRRTFYPRGATNKYNVPFGNQLDIDDDDLLSITKFTNGDGNEITSGDYFMKPANSTPKYAVKLKDSSSVTFEFDATGNDEQVLSISGSWGYSTTAPLDIKEACLEIASAWYHRRFGENMSSETVITAAGVVVTPKDIPAAAKSILSKYQRLV